MKYDKQRKKRRAAVSATDLAQMGKCERLVLFEHLYGSNPSVARMHAIQRGLAVHEWFYLEGLEATNPQAKSDLGWLATVRANIRALCAWLCRGMG